MPTRCIKVKLKPNTTAQVQAWAAELLARRDEVNATLVAEGVTWEAVFLDQQVDADYLIYVMHAHDLEHAAAVGKASTATIDLYHRAFKQACWCERSVLPTLIDFVVPDAATQD